MTTKELYPIAARAISWALHPLIIPLYLLLVLFSQTAFVHLSAMAKWYLCGIISLYGIALPSIGIILLKVWKKRKRLPFDRRYERSIPLLIGSVCYLIAAITISGIEIADFLRKIVLAAALVEGLVAWITLRWKISLHLTAAGLAIAIFLVLNLLGLPQMLLPFVAAIVMSGLLATARLYLQKNNPQQIAGGFGLGFAVGMVALLFF